MSDFHIEGVEIQNISDKLVTIDNGAVKAEVNVGIPETRQETLVEPVINKEEKIPEKLAMKVKRERVPDNSFQKVVDYFKENNIVLVEKKGKKNDAECIVKIPSKVGEIICYCRAKFKKSITDGDISAAYIQAQYKGQPLLFLYSGELSKKANEMLAGYPNIIIKKI